MQYNLTNTFTPIAEDGGMFYTRPGERVEIAVGDSAEYTGFILQGGIPLEFHGENIKARAVGKRATLNVTPSKGGGGGDDEYATDAEVEEMLDEVFGKN